VVEKNMGMKAFFHFVEMAVIYFGIPHCRNDPDRDFN